MCTVSWIHEVGGYQLFCNRDERLTRRAASIPQLLGRDGVHFLAPIDGDSGGTWLATNEFGVTVCLLNRNGRHRRRSRGLIVLDLASAKSIREAHDRIERLDLAPFAPFTLAVLARGKSATVFAWDGELLTNLPLGDACMPLISSPFDPAQVADRRRQELARIVRHAGRLDPTALFMFHQSHAASPGPYSPCMHRHDAETVSFSWLAVTDSEASFYYSAGAPCRSFTGETFTLALKKERARCLVCC
jgi:hypothetical protein